MAVTKSAMRAAFTRRLEAVISKLNASMAGAGPMLFRGVEFEICERRSRFQFLSRLASAFPRPDLTE
jgi:hypothetical protein